MACMGGVSGAKGNIGGEFSSALVFVNEDGSVTLSVGASDIGQGIKTSLAQIAAEELGVDLEDISVVSADTDVTPRDLGSYASRCTYVCGNAVRLAAMDAKRQLIGKASEILEAVPEELDLKDKTIYVRTDPKKKISLSRVAAEAAFVTPCSMIIGRASYNAVGAPPPFAAQFADVEVDLETGQVDILRIVAVHDVGRAINPLIVEGQVEGSLHMGIGYALTEELSVGKDGQILNRSFVDYKIPTPSDLPEVHVALVETIDPIGPFGAKAVGEPGLVATAPAIANAVSNAIGVRIREIPITPEKVLGLIKRMK